MPFLLIYSLFSLIIDDLQKYLQQECHQAQRPESKVVLFLTMITPLKIKFGYNVIYIIC